MVTGMLASVSRLLIGLEAADGMKQKANRMPVQSLVELLPQAQRRIRSSIDASDLCRRSFNPHAVTWCLWIGALERFMFDRLFKNKGDK